MTDPIHDDLRREMAAFEAARVKHAVELAPRTPQRVLAVRDGSDQDATGEHLLAALAERGAATDRFAPDAADAEPSAAILAAAAGCDLLLLPSPFRADYADVGRTSLTTTLDLVLARCEVPVLLVRGPLDADGARAALRRPLVLLQVHRHRKAEATELALGLAGHGGEIALLSVVDPGVALHREELVGRDFHADELSPDELEGLASARAAGVLAALQKGAADWHVVPRVHLRVGSVVETALELAADGPRLLVAGLDRSGPTDEAARARQLVLQSRHPVLLV